MLELADSRALKASGPNGHEGSSPSSGTQGLDPPHSLDDEGQQLAAGVPSPLLAHRPVVPAGGWLVDRKSSLVAGAISRTTIPTLTARNSP